MATVMLWDPEPISSLGLTEEDGLGFSEDDEKINNVEDTCFSSLTKKEIAQQLLEDIDNLVKREENDTFSQWFEEKIDLPIFDEIEPVLPAEELKPGVQHLQDLDEALKAANLTPPLSPNNLEVSTYIILDYNMNNVIPNAHEDISDYGFQSNHAAGPGNYITPAENYVCEGNVQLTSEADFLTAPPTPVPDLEKELAVVDELVRSTAQDLENQLWEEVSNSQSSSSDVGASSEAGMEDESDDPEWVPLRRRCAGKATVPVKKAKPYGREYTQEDRWLRKKEQNKNAATRYRQKKKAEVSEILEEEKMLEEKKGKLEQQVSDIQMEIKYLKGLMRDLFKAKGLLIN